MRISIPFRTATRALSALAVVAALAACGDDNGTGPNTGSVTVSVTSTGAGVSSAGYVVTVDNGDGQDVAANGDISISVNAGSHSVALTNLPSNCSVSGNNPVTVDVTAGLVGSQQVFSAGRGETVPDIHRERVVRREHTREECSGDEQQQKHHG